MNKLFRFFLCFALLMLGCKSVHIENDNNSVKPKNKSFDNSQAAFVYENKWEIDYKKIEVNITLIDGLTNQILALYNFDLIYVDEEGKERIIKCQTDSKGRFVFITPVPGLVIFQIITADYGISVKEFKICFGINQFAAKLYKGGQLYIYATDDKNQAISGLMVNLRFNNHAQDFKPLAFNEKQGVYIMPNVPCKMLSLYFKAKGFKISDEFVVTIDPNRKNEINIRLKRSRIIMLESDLNEKPDFLFIDRLEYGISMLNHVGRKLIPERTKCFKNKDGFYEFTYIEGLSQFSFSDEDPFLIYADNFAPSSMDIGMESTSFKINLSKGFDGKLQLVNEFGEPIVGAKIKYGANTNYGKTNIVKEALTDQNGFASLVYLSEKKQTFLEVSHIEYGVYSSVWDPTDREKIIELSNTLKISGKIKYEDKFISGVAVGLYKIMDDCEFLEAVCYSNSNGGYFFDYNYSRQGRLYVLKAFDPTFGVAKTAPFRYLDVNPNLELNLKKELSLKIKLVDSLKNPLTNKQVVLTAEDDFAALHLGGCSFCDNLFWSISVTTNSNGEFDFYNLRHLKYKVTLGEKDISIPETIINIPFDSIVLVAEKKDLRKINLTKPKGNKYTGELFVYHNYRTTELLHSIDLIVDKNGDYFLENPFRYVGVDNKLILDAPGYIPIEVGGFEKEDDFPIKFDLQLKANNSKLVTIKIIKMPENKPFQHTTVRIRQGDINAISKQTNEKGEIQFYPVKEDFSVDLIHVDEFVFKNSFSCKEKKEFVIEALKGGKLEGHFTIKDKYSRAEIILNNKSRSYFLDKNGNINIDQLVPGAYIITLKLTQIKDDQELEIEIPRKIIIENEKTTHIDFDKKIFNLEKNIEVKSTLK